jgi:hypothetical protein
VRPSIFNTLFFLCAVAATASAQDQPNSNTAAAAAAETAFGGVKGPAKGQPDEAPPGSVWLYCSLRVDAIVPRTTYTPNGIIGGPWLVRITAPLNSYQAYDQSVYIDLSRRWLAEYKPTFAAEFPHHKIGDESRGSPVGCTSQHRYSELLNLTTLTEALSRPEWYWRSPFKPSFAQ